MFNIEQLLQIACVPAANQKEWLQNAESAVSYVDSNSQSEEVILYACVQQAWIYSVLAPMDKLKDCDLEDLQREYVDPCSSCGIDYSLGNDDEVYIADPFDGSAIFDGGEQLVFRRRFDGVDKDTRTEISQRLVHALGLYWLEHESAFCKLDKRGDVLPVLRVIDLQK